MPRDQETSVLVHRAFLTLGLSGLVFSQVPAVASGDRILEFRWLIFQLDHSFPYGASVEEMDQIENPQAGGQFRMLTWILTYLFSLICWNLCTRKVPSKIR